MVARVVLTIIIAVMAMIFYRPAKSMEAVVKNMNKDEIRLFESKCSHGGTLAIIKKQFRSRFKNARAIVDGKMWYGCWILKEDNITVRVIFEDGDQQDVEAWKFKVEPGV